jgi:hypothetical protein
MFVSNTPGTYVSGISVRKDVILWMWEGNMLFPSLQLQGGLSFNTFRAQSQRLARADTQARASSAAHATATATGRASAQRNPDVI